MAAPHSIWDLSSQTRDQTHALFRKKKKKKKPMPSAVEAAAAAAKLLQSCPVLCDPIDGTPPGSPIPGILQARILEWVAISFSNP